MSFRSPSMVMCAALSSMFASQFSKLSVAERARALSAFQAEIDSVGSSSPAPKDVCEVKESARISAHDARCEYADGRIDGVFIRFHPKPDGGYYTIGKRQLSWPVNDNYLGRFSTRNRPGAEARITVVLSSMELGETTSGRQTHWGSPSGHLQETQRQVQPGSGGGQDGHQRAFGAATGGDGDAAVATGCARVADPCRSIRGGLAKRDRALAGGGAGTDGDDAAGGDATASSRAIRQCAAAHASAPGADMECAVWQ